MLPIVNFQANDFYYFHIFHFLFKWLESMIWEELYSVRKFYEYIKFAKF